MTKKIIGSCGCEISDAKSHIGKDVHVCSKCGQKCCDKHYFVHIDGNNIAITKWHLKHGICSKCANR